MKMYSYENGIYMSSRNDEKVKKINTNILLKETDTPVNLIIQD